MAAGMTERNKGYLIHVVMTFFDSKVLARQPEFTDSSMPTLALSCHAWMARSRYLYENEHGLKQKLPSDKGFSVNFRDLKVMPGLPRPNHARNWKDHDFIEIKIGPTGATKYIYFDNGGLGTQMTTGIINSYGGVFFEVPNWLGPQ